MKTTIDIPEPLYKRAKIRAIETGQTLKQIVLKSLEHELKTSHPLEARAPLSFMQRRRLTPDFAEMQRDDSLKPKPNDRDITDLISDDRDGR